MKFFIFKLKHAFLVFIILILVLEFLIYIKLCSNSPSHGVEATSLDSAPNSLNSILSDTQKVVYLTFDDGPTKKITPKILDILKEENIKASFFVIGKHVKEHPEVVRRAYEEGHFIANHGYSHNGKLMYKNEESFLKEITDTDKEIANAIGKDAYCSHIFRFPNGFLAPLYKKQKKSLVSSLSKINYYYIDWNCLNKDSERKFSNSQLLNNLKKSAKGKSTLVILMHDTGDVNNTYDVLKDSIKYLKSNGYIFKNFYEINPPLN